MPRRRAFPFFCRIIAAYGMHADLLPSILASTTYTNVVFEKSMLIHTGAYRAICSPPLHGESELAIHARVLLSAIGEDARRKSAARRMLRKVNSRAGEFPAALPNGSPAPFSPFTCSGARGHVIRFDFARHSARA